MALPEDRQPEWIETPAISVQGTGNLGNQLIRFMAIKYLAEHLAPCTISNFAFPEWNVHFPQVDHTRFRKTILIDHIEQFDPAYLLDAVRREPSLHIHVRHFLQRQELFLPPTVYNGIFPVNPEGVPVFGDDSLVINIRTGDITGGAYDFYPLMPIGFYAELIERTGLRPVFMGQLDDCLYVRTLRETFPDATFIPSQGPLRDFDTLRLATHIVPAVSTFSVIGAWLSRAKTVFLPLNGFLNPCHRREIDLLPVGDPRYRFFLFPLNYALPEERALEQHRRMAGLWKEVSHQRVRVLQTQAPLVAKSRTWVENYRALNFNHRWYVHEYLDAAVDISDGWYEDAMHHYLDAGRHRGYRPYPGAEEPAYPNIAIGCPATQSSVSPWSNGKTVEEDAANAVSGDNTMDSAFHTSREENPWWRVDLGETHAVMELRIYNRKGAFNLQSRTTPLSLLASQDGATWSEFYRMPEGATFGTEDRGASPLVHAPATPIFARHIMVKLLQPNECLNLAQVEIYGLPALQPTAEPQSAPEAPPAPPRPPAPPAPRRGWFSRLTGWRGSR